MNITLNIIAIGVAPFITQFAASAVLTTMNRSLSLYGGDTAVSAMGIISSISLLTLMPLFGINQGSQPIISYNYGANGYFGPIRPPISE
jgi:Na+-driven multidrug efflux pump